MGCSANFLFLTLRYIPDPPRPRLSRCDRGFSGGIAAEYCRGAQILQAFLRGWLFLDLQWTVLRLTLTHAWHTEGVYNAEIGRLRNELTGYHTPVSNGDWDVSAVPSYLISVQNTPKKCLVERAFVI